MGTLDKELVVSNRGYVGELFCIF